MEYHYLMELTKLGNLDLTFQVGEGTTDTQLVELNAVNVELFSVPFNHLEPIKLWISANRGSPDYRY